MLRLAYHHRRSHRDNWFWLACDRSLRLTNYDWLVHPRCLKLWLTGRDHLGRRTYAVFSHRLRIPGLFGSVAFFYLRYSHPGAHVRTGKLLLHHRLCANPVAEVRIRLEACFLRELSAAHAAELVGSRVLGVTLRTLHQNLSLQRSLSS